MTIKNIMMAKYRVKSAPKRQVESATDIKDEKKFFKVAIIVTVVLLALVYLVYSNM